MLTPDRETLLTCLRVERWASELADREFASVEELVDAAMAAATPLSEAEVDEALAAHPRIGEAHGGHGAEARFSTSEQGDSDTDDEQLARALEQGNAAYEARFGRVFLIRAAGRDRREILAEMDRRILNGDSTELDEVAEQLREIAALRLRRTYEEAP